MIERFDISLGSLPSLAQLLRAYAEHLVPWARRIATRMILEVSDRDREAWRELGNAISLQLHHDLERAPIGTRVHELLNLQVGLITSIPRDAGERVHKLTLASLESSARAKEATAEIARSAEVTQSRALLIARTETARTATQLVRARAEFVGATHYIWRTAEDGAVRPGHRAMEGKTCAWADPPAVNEDGRIMHFHPGEIWNCRCYAEPVIANPYDMKARYRRRA